MKKVTSKRLVIDACVARSAGETDHPRSAACRGYLLDILAICHRIVMTPEIRAEWQKHQSRFSQRWLTQMIAKKKFVPMQVNLEVELWEQAELIESEKDRSAILKDLHLLLPSHRKNTQARSSSSKLSSRLAMSSLRLGRE